MKTAMNLLAGYGLALSFSAQAQTPPPADTFPLRVPSGHTVTVDCGKLGPGRVETLDFWKQLEPKDHGLPAFAVKDNTNPRAILWLKDHLNQHGIGAGHIKAVAERCKAVPAGAAEPVRTFK